MVVAGMTPAQVIVAATRNSADLLGLTDVGTVEAGMSADFVVLEANPLDDITNTRRIHLSVPARRGGGPCWPERTLERRDITVKPPLRDD